MNRPSQLRIYYFTAIFSIIFAIVGFSYNTWRLEVSESNNNVRTAAFEILKVLAEFQQVVYAAHYDQDIIRGNPRTGWVKVGLAQDLSTLVAPRVTQKVKLLVTVWAESWSELPEKRKNADRLIDAITEVRKEIKITLSSLN